MMGYLAHVVRSKGLANVLPRALAIGRNFGFTEARTRRRLEALGELTTRYGCPLTACVTACLVERYRRPVEAMRRWGWEIAVHGKVHCDFRGLSQEQQVAQMEEALDLCRRHVVPACGFRAPYLAWNGATRQAASRARFAWTSNQALLWPVLDPGEHSPRGWEALERVLEHLYRPRLAEQSVSVPQIRQGVVEIPVSLPDDEILLDRLRVSGPVLERLWLRVLDESHGRGELAVLLIHHERVPHFARPLEGVLKAAQGLGSLWLADLGSIAAWWQERANFSFRVAGGPGRWEVQADCSPRAAVLLKNGAPGEATGWRPLEERRLRLDVPVRPTVGAGPEVAPEAIAFLRNEGFPVESLQADHALVLDGPKRFGPEAERALLERASAAPGPLLRFWRWPRGIRSALALSMDVDSVTLLDFVKRPLQR
jgi:peptidoglycan/xylan/chitin deacetylase (PgdA/CDA1 family)